MIVILFRSKLTDTAGADYSNMLAEIERYLRTREGFLDVKAFTAEDGERLTVVWWKDKETLEAWQNDLRHMEAKKAGRARWYRYYDMEIAEVIRESHFLKPGMSLHR